MLNFSRLFVLAGGLIGAAGVGLAASAAHAGGAFTQTISNMLLFHAPLFVAIGLLSGAGRFLSVAAGMLLAGLVLFSLDLYVRDLGMARLFPFAAPLGGTAMIAGWLGIALSAFFRNRQSRL